MRKCKLKVSLLTVVGSQMEDSTQIGHATFMRISSHPPVMVSMAEVNSELRSTT